MTAIASRPTVGAVEFAVPGEPVSKSRARFTGRGSKTRAYTPAKTLAGERAVALHFRSAGGRFEPDAEVTFGVQATFLNGTRQRRDVDNMLKLILDGLNGVAWVDDVQVVEVTARKMFVKRDDARTEVSIYRIGRVDRLTKPCEQCAQDFVTYESLKRMRFCSRACGDANRLAARQCVCEHCGAGFLAHAASHGRRFCSRACQAASGWVEIECDHCRVAFKRRKCHIKAKNYCSTTCRDATFAAQHKLRSKGVCSDCGTSTSDKRAVRCQPCQWAKKAHEKAARLAVVKESS